MKKFCLFLAAVAMLVLGMVMLTGCASRDEALVGSWSWDLNSDYVTTFNADGTGTHALDWGLGYGTTFRWSTSGRNINWNYPNHPRLVTPYTVSGDVLTMTLADGSQVRYLRNR